MSKSPLSEVIVKPYRLLSWLSLVLLWVAPLSYAQETYPPVKEGYTRIAVLLPEQASPLSPYSTAIASGVKAANLSDADPYEIVYLQRKPGQPVQSLLHDAALIGSSVVIGPISKPAMEELAQLPYLPIPVVALNALPEGAKAQPWLLSCSLSLEDEARQIARIAVQALPVALDSGEAPEIRIFEKDSPREQRIAQAYADELTKANIPFQRMVIGEDASLLPKLFDTRPVPREDMPEYEPLPDRYEFPYEHQKAVLRNNRIKNDFDTLLAYREPPFSGALLALDHSMAALIRPRLPRLTHVWGTRIINPDEAKGGIVSSLSYDLIGMAFTECPIVAVTDAKDFLQKYGVEMPESVWEKRLFGLGSDAYALAKQWAMLAPAFEMLGCTGKLRYDVAQGYQVQRESVELIVTDKGNVQKPIEELILPIPLPDFVVTSEALQHLDAPPPPPRPDLEH